MLQGSGIGISTLSAIPGTLLGYIPTNYGNYLKYFDVNKYDDSQRYEEGSQRRVDNVSAFLRQLATSIRVPVFVIGPIVPSQQRRRTDNARKEPDECDDSQYEIYRSPLGMHDGVVEGIIPVKGNCAQVQNRCRAAKNV